MKHDAIFIDHGLWCVNDRLSSSYEDKCSYRDWEDLEAYINTAPGIKVFGDIKKHVSL